MQSQKDDFSLKNYKRCLELSLSLGYNFYTLDDYFCNRSSSEKNIILRHDVDTQLDIALRKADIEKELGVKSTYFIRLHSHNYNFFCIKDLNKIIDILSLGHEIGLHYETDFYILNKKDIQQSINKEIGIMEYYLNQKIKTVCPHEPTRTNCFPIKGLTENQA